MEMSDPRINLLEIDPRFLSWEKLERSRLRNLNIPNRYSRNFNISRSPDQAVATSLDEPRAVLQNTTPRTVRPMSTHSVDFSSNSVAPFYTAEKPTCGYFFSRSTENKKKKFGIPPSDLVKWRSMSAFPSTSQ